jgi:NAD(P)-dependent dehydrogenase (short-subunit alcohol dehydrogenase family)
MPGRLAGKVCVITGAASGQGRVAAEIFAREGALLVLGDVDQEGLDEIDEIVRSQGGTEPVIYVGDLTRESTNEELFGRAFATHGRVDAVYNAAGLVRFSPIHETRLDDWRFTIDHELTMAFLACKHAVRAMLESGGGSIINISSVSGLFGSPRHASHAAAKAGITGLTKQIAVEYGPNSIRCNAIAPGFLVYAPGQRRIASQTREMLPDHIPLRRFTHPEDTAHCALFLASDESSYITGQVIVVDGGASAH